jgi:hypothetical protein
VLHAVVYSMGIQTLYGKRPPQLLWDIPHVKSFTELYNLTASLRFPREITSEFRNKFRRYARHCQLVPVAAQSNVFGSSPAEVLGSNPTGNMDVCLL